MYSNITAFILTQLIERITGQNFYDLVRERVFIPLGMDTATFYPKTDQISAIPPTEITAERGLVQGFVHDEFTYYTTQGGVSNGAAGLFASVQDLAPFLGMALGRGSYHGQTITSQDLVARWTEDYFPSLLPMHTPLAWGDQNNVYLDQYHRNMVLKSGFTGCFMVGDLTAQRGFVLLSNRTYPTRPTDKVAFSSIKESLLATIL
jgi:CubicO group peptidase (beta-lactamase class C family)